TYTKNYKKMINELRLGVTQFRFTESPQDAGFDASTLGFTNKSLQTILLSGLDTRYSGAAPGMSGAYGGWWDSFWSNSAGANTSAFRAPSFDYALNQQPNFNGLFNAPNYAGYAQDSWKLTPRITVNMGVRYEFFGVPKEANDQIWNYDPVANGLVQQGGSTVVDPFGQPCTGAVTSFLTDSIPRSISNNQFGQWQCGASKNGNI